MRETFAYFVSLIFHPLLMPSYLFLFIIRFATSLMQPLRVESLYEILTVIFVVTFIVPVLSLGTLRLTKYIDDFSLEKREQRIVPFLFISCFYGITTYMFYSKLSVNNIIVVVFGSTTFLILILTLITVFWKISVHGAAVGGIIGFITALSMLFPIASMGLILAVLVLIAGIIIHSRLLLNAHTPSQAYIGTMLGFFVCYFSTIGFL